MALGYRSRYQRPPPTPGFKRGFADLFSGSGTLGKLAEKGGWTVSRFEAYRNGVFAFPQEDLSDIKVVRSLCSRIQSYEFDHVHLGVPCTTWTVMQYSFGGTRTKTAPLGNGTRQAEKDANIVVMMCFLIIWACIGSHTRFTVENPLTSVLWSHNDFKALLMLPFVTSVDLDMCMFGLCSPKGALPKVLYKKPTRILGTLIAEEHLNNRCTKCHTHGSLARQEYFVLPGGERLLKSRHAGSYPIQFCRALLAAVS
jgi:hypothetical protein